jgi:Zn-dependent peptidase ImmA (M78 family)
LCNRFAGSFLVPESYIQPLLNGIEPVATPDPDDVAWAARRLKISHQATVLRLEQLGFYEAGSHDKWKRITHNSNPDFTEKGGGASEPPPQEKVKLAKYGFRFAAIFDEQLQRGRISEINLYRSTGLKPKYQKPYFSYTRNVNSDELQTLEFDYE